LLPLNVHGRKTAIPTPVFMRRIAPKFTGIRSF
jgi:hypothetical protein